MKKMFFMFAVVLMMVSAINAEVVVSTLINDGFDDGGRTDGVDTLDADWWKVYDYTLGIDPNDELGSGNSLSISNDGTGSSLVVANFPNQALDNEGDSIAFSFDIQLLGMLADDNIRFALLDSKGTLVESDVSVDDMADDDHSYFIRLGTGTVAESRIYQDTNSSSPMGGTGISNKASGPFGIGDNNVHSIKLSYTHVGGNIKTDFVLDEGTAEEKTLSWTDNLDPILNYSEAGILIRKGMEALIDNIVVEFTEEANHKPDVDAGVDLFVQVNESVQLASSSSDPEGQPLTYLWTVSGPGTATFTPDETTENPAVSFDTVGIYTLELTVSDGVLSAGDSMTVMVYPEGWNGQMAYMPYDSNPEDYGVWGYDVTVIGNPTYSTSTQTGTGAIEFDGIDDCLEYDPNLASNVTDMTFMCWARRDVLGSTTDMEIAGNYPNYDGEEQGWRLFFDEGGYFKIWLGKKWNVTSYWNINDATWNVGEWVHVAMTFKYNGGSGNNVKFYVNGVEKLDETTNYEVFPNSTVPFVVGRRSTGGSFLDGAIDDLYVFGRALEQAEISELAGLNTPPTVDAGQSQKILLPTNSVDLTGLATDIQDDENGVELEVAWSVVDYDPNITVTFDPVDDVNTTVTFTGNAEFSPAGDYLLRLTVTDSHGASTSDDVVVKVRPEGFDGLEAHFTFDNPDPNFAFTSNVGIGYKGTPHGGAGVIIQDANFPDTGALSLDGLDDFVECSKYLGAEKSITVSAWFKCNDSAAGGRIVEKWANDNSQLGWFTRIRPDNGGGDDYDVAAMIGSAFGGNGVYQDGWNNMVIDGKWSHIVLTFSEDRIMRLWLDGALNDQNTNVQYSPEDIVTPFTIGRRYSTNKEYFNGLIDNVRIYDYALSVEEVKALYTAEGGQPWNTCNPPMAGDLNNDCKVDLQDVAEMGADWQGTYDITTLADLAVDWLNCSSYDLSDCF